jgi:hypothetical protein
MSSILNKLSKIEKLLVEIKIEMELTKTDGENSVQCKFTEWLTEKIGTLDEKTYTVTSMYEKFSPDETILNEIKKTRGGNPILAFGRILTRYGGLDLGGFYLKRGMTNGNTTYRKVNMS